MLDDGDEDDEICQASVSLLIKWGQYYLAHRAIMG